MRRVVPTWRAAALALWAGAAVSCGGGGGDDPPDTGGPPPPPPPDPQFSNITASTGIEFVHGIVNPTDSKAEMFGGGVAAGDYDGDGDLDLYVVRGNIGPNLLYRNDGEQPVHRRRGCRGRRPCRPRRRWLPPQRADLRRRRRRRRPRPVRRRHGGGSLHAVLERRRRHVHRRHRRLGLQDDGRQQHDLGGLRRLRPRRRPRHDAGALGHAAAARRLRRQRGHRIPVAQRQRRERDPLHQRQRRVGHRRDDHRAARRVFRVPARRARLRLQLHAVLRAHGRGPLSRHPERGGLQQHPRLHEQRRERRGRELSRRDGQRRDHRPQRHGRRGRRRGQRRRSRLVRHRHLRLQRDRR